MADKKMYNQHIINALDWLKRSLCDESAENEYFWEKIVKVSANDQTRGNEEWSDVVSSNQIEDYINYVTIDKAKDEVNKLELLIYNDKAPDIINFTDEFLKLGQTFSIDFGLSLTSLKVEKAPADVTANYVAIVRNDEKEPTYYYKDKLLSMLFDQPIYVDCEMVNDYGVNYISVDLGSEKNPSIVNISRLEIPDDEVQRYDRIKLNSECDEVNNLLSKGRFSAKEAAGLSENYVWQQLNATDGANPSFICVFYELVEGEYHPRRNLALRWRQRIAKELTKVIKTRVVKGSFDNVIKKYISEMLSRKFSDNSSNNIHKICSYIMKMNLQTENVRVKIVSVRLLQCLHDYAVINTKFNSIIEDVKKRLTSTEAVPYRGMKESRMKMVKDYLSKDEMDSFNEGVPRLLVKSKDGRPRSLKNSKWSDYGLMYISYLFDRRLYLSKEADPEDDTRNDYGYRIKAFKARNLTADINGVLCEFNANSHQLALVDEDRTLYSKSVVKLPVIELAFEMFEELREWISEHYGCCFDVRQYIMLQAMADERYDLSNEPFKKILDIAISDSKKILVATTKAPERTEPAWRGDGARQAAEYVEAR